VSDNVVMGQGEDIPNKIQPKIYSFGLVTIGEDSYIPAGVRIGKNTAISGKTVTEDYPDYNLESGGYIIKGVDN